MDIRVVSERNLGQTLSKKNSKVEVRLDPSNNRIEVTDKGLRVAKPQMISIVDLSGNIIGNVEVADTTETNK